MRFGLLFRLFKESVVFALNALWVNKMRTILSLLGVTIGIFSIISVFTMVDSLEKEVRGSVESLGDDVLFIQKWPWGFDSDYAWWKFMNRPQPTYDEFKWLQRDLENAGAVSMMYSFSRHMTYKSRSVGETSLMAVSHEYDKVRDFEIAAGRYFSMQESASGSPVCIIGALIAITLFNDIHPVGKTIKIGKQNAQVIGVFKPEGESMLGPSLDDMALIPLNFGRKMVNMETGQGSPSIMAKAKEGITNARLKDDVTVLMRAIRRLKPKAENNFAINEISVLSKAFDSLFAFINTTGLIIGMFSILVGGFSIANIMFVSVKERTNIIGIQKALGAKNFFVLFQFLTESVILCLIGGGVGLLLIFLGALGVNAMFDMSILLSFKNIGLGLLISTVIGLVAGILPALSAARMDPVQAIRSTG